MNCVVCRERNATIGVLCEECHDELPGPLRITPEQVTSRGGRSGKAVLIDCWGRPHRLSPRTLVGRQNDAGLALLEASISRHHAHLNYEASDEGWTLRDLGSSNGTFHNDAAVTAQAVKVKSGDRVTFGHVGFYFCIVPSALPQVELDPRAAATLKPGPGMTMAELVAGAKAEATLTETLADDDAESEFERSEHTDPGLPVIAIELLEPTGGGGGVVDFAGRQVQLTMTQFEFVRLLIKRMADETHQPELVRGFVRSSELIADLSWDTREPGDNHVKQLVRRVRRALIKGDIGDLIESRHRFGYRLRAIPK